MRDATVMTDQERRDHVAQVLRAQRRRLRLAPTCPVTRRLLREWRAQAALLSVFKRADRTVWAF